MIDFTNVRLGRAAHDPDRVAALPTHIVGADAPPPLVLPRREIIFRPGLYRNDVFGDCSCAGLANSRRAASLIFDKCDLVSTDAAVTSFFAGCAKVPFTDAALASVPGLVVLDVFDYAQKHGFTMGGQTVEVPSDIRVIDPADRVVLAHAIAVRGSAYLGIDLYAPDVAPGASWKGLPSGASVGGHAIVAWAYDGLGDANTVWLASWGMLIAATWQWLQSRLMEAYSISWAG